MKLTGIDFTQEYVRAALMVSLLSVWLLVGLFVYLNRYTKREYFTVWTAAWLFYALWLTLSLRAQHAALNSPIFMLKQWCVAISAVFLLWGSLRFLNLPVRQTLFGLFMAFLLVWTFISPKVLTNSLEIEMPGGISLDLLNDLPHEVAGGTLRVELGAMCTSVQAGGITRRSLAIGEAQRNLQRKLRARGPAARLRLRALPAAPSSGLYVHLCAGRDPACRRPFPYSYTAHSLSCSTRGSPSAELHLQPGTQLP